MKTTLISCAALALAGAAVAQIGPPFPPPAPVQVRIVEEVARNNLRIEADLGSPQQMAVLLVSDEDLLVSVTGIVSPLILPQVVVPLGQVNALTCAHDVSLVGSWPGQEIYLQVLTLDPSGRVSASGVAPYEIREPGTPPPGAPWYSGPPVRYAEVALTREPPLPCTFAVHVEVTVASSDWDLRHQVTLRHAEGTDILLTLKKPGPGEGLLDVVETHEQLVDVGSEPAGTLRVLIAQTAEAAPRVGQLEFRQVLAVRDPHEAPGVYGSTEVRGVSP